MDTSWLFWHACMSCCQHAVMTQQCEMSGLAEVPQGPQVPDLLPTASCCALPGCRALQPAKNPFLDTLKTVVVDIRFFLFLLLLTVWGFACAFYILFRRDQSKHVRPGSANEQFPAQCLAGTWRACWLQICTPECPLAPREQVCPPDMRKVTVVLCKRPSGPAVSELLVAWWRHCSTVMRVIGAVAGSVFHHRRVLSHDGQHAGRRGRSYHVPLCAPPPPLTARTSYFMRQPIPVFETLSVCSVWRIDPTLPSSGELSAGLVRAAAC